MFVGLKPVSEFAVFSSILDLSRRSTVFCAVHDDYTSNKHISDSSFCCVKMQHSVGSLFLKSQTRHLASTLRPSADEQTLGNALCLLWPAACRVPARDILSLSLSLASFLRVIFLL